MPPTSSAPDIGQTRFLTGEAVHLEVRVARLGSRAMGKLIDIVIQVVLVMVLFLVLLLVVGLLQSIGLLVFDTAVWSVCLILATVMGLIGYPVLMETLTRGRTLGKLIMGLRVVRDDGGPITFRHALTRNLIGVAIEWPGILGAPLTWLVTVWTMIASPQSKRIGDHVAGTIVVHERTPAAWGWVPQLPTGMAGWAATLDLTGLDDDLALAVRHYLSRNRQIREPARTQLGERLAREVAAVTNPPPPHGAPGWAYLAAVHAERHRRATRQLVAVRARAATVWPDLVAVTAVPSPAGALEEPYRTPTAVAASTLPTPQSASAATPPAPRAPYPGT